MRLTIADLPGSASSDVRRAKTRALEQAPNGCGHRRAVHQAALGDARQRAGALSQKLLPCSPARRGVNCTPLMLLDADVESDQRSFGPEPGLFHDRAAEASHVTLCRKASAMPHDAFAPAGHDAAAPSATPDAGRARGARPAVRPHPACRAIAQEASPTRRRRTSSA